jgi:hypothetical protein
LYYVRINCLLRGHALDTVVKVLAHDDTPLADVVRHLHLLQEVGRHLLQRVLRPLREPVDRAGVHQAGEHAQLVPETGPNRRHGQHNVKVSLDVRQKDGEEIHERGFADIFAAFRGGGLNPFQQTRLFMKRKFCSSFTYGNKLFLVFFLVYLFVKVSIAQCVYAQNCKKKKNIKIFRCSPSNTEINVLKPRYGSWGIYFAVFQKKRCKNCK